MNIECPRIADQLRRAFAGEAWHGPALRFLLNDVTFDQALVRPPASAHNIRDLVLHIELWTRIALEATEGVPMPKPHATGEDWPSSDDGQEEWADAKGMMFRTAEKLADTIERFPDERLKETVPGRPYDFYYLFHGIVQHSLYHAGQIALLKRLNGS